MSNFNDVSEKEMQDMLKFLDSLDDENNDVDYNAIMETLGLDIPELEKEIQEYIPTIDLSYKKTKENAIDPKYAYISDSGFDLYSTEDVWIHSLDRQLVSTGLHFDIPEGYEIQVRSKSGLAINQGLFVLNSPGTVDNGYLGEIKVIIFNTNSEPFTIKKGMKVAQAVLCPVVNGKWVNLEERKVISDKDRGNNGFGSTGI
jgi:dUTP pyrophosphatase